jgi:hypothetical protein
MWEDAPFSHHEEGLGPAPMHIDSTYDGGNYTEIEDDEYDRYATRNGFHVQGRSRHEQRY